VPDPGEARRPDGDEQRRIRHVPTPPGWVPALGLIFPTSSLFPWGSMWRSMWRIATGVLAGVATTLVLETAGPRPGSGPLIAGMAVCLLGYVCAFASMVVEDRRMRVEHPERFPSFERPPPALPPEGMRLVMAALAGCLVAAGAAAGALLAADHARLAAAVGVGVLILAIPSVGVASWWSIRCAGAPPAQPSE
jgi:hypothetical protein